MKRHRITATLLAPLVARKERQSQRSEGVSSLSGTLVRGALAQLYLGVSGVDDTLFRRLFLDEETCRYGPLDPAPQVFPLSAVSCKREPGFAAQGKHGLADLLWLRIARRLLGRELPEPLRERGMRCAFPGCDHDLKAMEGFWGTKDGRPAEAKGLWYRGVDAHVGIDRFTHSAHESILYSLPVLTPRRAGMPLTGILECGEDEAAQLRKLLDAEEGEVRIGHARTRGYGRVLLEIAEEMPNGTSDPEQWSRALIDFLCPLKDARTSFDPARHFFFSMGLPTGALLLDEVLRYTLDPAGMVSWLPPLPKGDVWRPVLDNHPRHFEGGKLWCVGAITRHERLRGWNAAHGLPRQDEWAISRGAVYAYLFEGDEAGRRILHEKLAGLAAGGVGARRVEGLGRVLVSDEFHRQFHFQESQA